MSSLPGSVSTPSTHGARIDACAVLLAVWIWWGKGTGKQMQTVIMWSQLIARLETPVSGSSSLRQRHLAIHPGAKVILRQQLALAENPTERMTKIARRIKILGLQLSLDVFCHVLWYFWQVVRIAPIWSSKNSWFWSVKLPKQCQSSAAWTPGCQHHFGMLHSGTAAGHLAAFGTCSTHHQNSPIWIKPRSDDVILSVMYPATSCIILHHWEWYCNDLTDDWILLLAASGYHRSRHEQHQDGPGQHSRTRRGEASTLPWLKENS